MKNLNLIIKPTNACNLRCKHCYHAEKGYDEQLLPIEYIEKAISVFSQEYSEISILWHGGEPMLVGAKYFSRVLNRIAQSAQSNNCKISYRMQTNATLIDDTWVEIIKNNNIKLGVSFDGPFNDDLRQGTERVLESIEMLQNNNIKFGLLSVVTSKNISKLNELVDWFNSKKLSFKFNPIFESGEAKCNNDYIISPDDYIHNFCLAFVSWLHNIECEISISSFEKYIILDSRTCTNTSCMYKWLSMDSSGNFFPCGRPYPIEFTLGNISQISSSTDLFDSDQYKMLLSQATIRRKSCIETCKWAGFCQGGCNASALIENKLSSTDFWECVTEKAILEFTQPYAQKFYSDVAIGNYSEYNPMIVKYYLNKKKNKPNRTPSKD